MLAGDGRPTATLAASPISLWNSTYVFKVTYTDDQAVDVRTLDDADLTISGPNGLGRRAKFWRSVPEVNAAIVGAYYKMSAPGGVWDAFDNGAYTITLNASQVRDADGNSARSAYLGNFAVSVPQYPSTLAVSMATKGIIGADATRFGAVPDDGLDDTAAIQRAIDSLPRDGDGVPDAGTPIGGTVIFPRGTFNTSTPLRIPTAVRLRGQGAATIISNTSANSTEGAIEFVSYSGHGFNIRAGVENLTLNTTAAKGIKALTLPGDIVSLRLLDLTLSTGGTAIDLRLERVYDAELRNITVKNPGSTALWLGPADGVSNVNRINGFTVLGTARPGFQADRAMVVLGGDVSVEGLTVADTGAAVLPLYASGTPTIRRLQILATTNVPNGVIARFENGFAPSLDRISSISGSRRIEIRNTREMRIGSVNLASNARLIDSINIDSASHLTIVTLRSSSDPGLLTDPRIMVRGRAAPDQDPALLPSFVEPTRPVAQTVADVGNFGAIANDAIDDTAAIQAAIDWLPKGNGLPGTGDPVGGLVLFGAGRYLTSSPIAIPSGVWLRGQGHSTSIYNVSPDGSRGAFEFVGNPTHGYNVGAAIEDLGIYTLRSRGIRADASISASLVDARISGLQISAGDRAIDLSEVRTYHTSIQGTIVSDPGSTALWLGDAGGYSADNRVIGLQLQGTARSGFRAEKALVVLSGEYLYQNGWLEHPGATVVPLSISGSATIRGLWLEYPAQNLINRVVALFENTTRVEIDRLTHIEPTRRLLLQNAKGVRIDFLSIDGATATLRDCVSVDANSQLSVGLVSAQMDSGLLDHPRVSIDAAYNAQDRMVIQNRVPSPTQNLVADPEFSGLGSKPREQGLADAWTITWGDVLGAIQGTATVEQTASGQRLKIVITSNPNNRWVAVTAKLNIPASAVGKYGIARWRIDGAGAAIAYTRNFASQYSARAMNGATSARTPQPLRADEQIVFLLPPALGTYYLSGVSMSLA